MIHHEFFGDLRSAPGGWPGSHHVFRGRFRFRSWHRDPNFGEDSHGWKKNGRFTIAKMDEHMVDCGGLMDYNHDFSVINPIRYIYIYYRYLCLRTENRSRKTRVFEYRDCGLGWGGVGWGGGAC